MFAKCSNPTCPCTSFEITRIEAAGAAHAFYAVNCSVCKTTAGVVEAMNNSQQLINLTKRVDELAVALRRVDHNVATIGEAMQRQNLLR